MHVCHRCGAEFAIYPTVAGKRLNLRGRKQCLDCRPHRRQRRPRKTVPRQLAQRGCDACGALFALRQVIEGKLRYLHRRRFCLDCSPFGTHNTSKRPPGIKAPEELAVHRRRRRNAKTYRSQKSRRRRRKAELVEVRGGRCMECGYSACIAALEFHHRDASIKAFGLGNFDGSFARLLREAEKCDLVCASCHRIRHGRLDEGPVRGTVALRRERKARAVDHMGRVCLACGRTGPDELFEFHHRDAREKAFGISEAGVLRRWERVVAELAKCVMLCANCHREVHAGVRELDEGLLGLAEAPLAKGPPSRASSCDRAEEPPPIAPRRGAAASA